MIEIIPLGPDTHRSEPRIMELSPFQRVLMAADGTLTKILEAYLVEKLKVIKLSEKILPTKEDIPPLHIKAGTEVVEREILLQGETSGCNWLYADSIIVPERLSEEFRNKLLKSHVPIGKLWLEHKTETYKEIVSLSRQLAGEIGIHFKVNAEDKLLCRAYCVFSGSKPIMMIQEKFPKSYFV